MSLPKFEVQGSLFESLEWAAADLFDDKEKYWSFQNLGDVTAFKK